MAEKFSIEFDVRGLDQAVRGLGALGGAIGGSGGMSGLLSGAGGLLGGRFGASLGKMLPVIGKVVVGLGALGVAAHKSASALTQFSQMRNMLGSSASTTAFLRDVGGALGVDMGALAMRAQSASQSGMGAAAAARAGLSPAFDIGTAVDRGARLERLLEHGRRLFEQNERAALAFFRQLDIEEGFDYVRLKQTTIELMRQEAELSKEMYSSERLNAAYAYNAQLSRIQRKWEMFTTTIGSKITPLLEKVLEFANSGRLGRLLFGGSVPNVPGAGAGGRSGIDANTAALNANTLEIRRLQGLYGGGNRARSAIPAAYGPGFGFFLQDALRAHTVKLGAYSVQM